MTIHSFAIRAVAILTVASAGAIAVPVSAHDMHAHYGSQIHAPVHARVITISCYRGPWNEVIWDRPNPVFTDSLIAAGYSFPEANAIAERVCRDPGSVGRPETMRAVMQSILNSSPPGS